MRVSETLRTSIRSLGLNKVRSFLTMLGVVIGVFAVISLIALGRGMQNYISEQFDALGSNLLFVMPGRMDMTADPARNFARNKLEKKHVDMINTYASEYVENVAPHIEIGEKIRYKTKTFNAGVIGSSYVGKDMYNFDVKEGSFFTKTDETTKSRVVILGPEVVKKLFPNRSPIGETVKIGDDSYKVIGVFKEKGRAYDEQVIVPYTTLSDTFDIKNYGSISIKVRNAQDVDTATKQIRSALLRDLKPDDFSVMSQKDILSTINSILGILTSFLGAIAGISLLVGGIGIMNIMLVSVTERTREIGLRKALGATSKNIAFQFMIEAILLSIGGGIIGLLFGYLASFVARSFIRAEIPIWSIILALGFSMVVGVLFGTYPALKASRKDPIEALRYE